MHFARYPRAMIATLKTFARVVATPVHLKRTLLIAFVVGVALVEPFQPRRRVVARGDQRAARDQAGAELPDAVRGVELRAAGAPAALIPCGCDGCILGPLGMLPVAGIALRRGRPVSKKRPSEALPGVV